MRSMMGRALPWVGLSGIALPVGLAAAPVRAQSTGPTSSMSAPADTLDEVRATVIDVQGPDLVLDLPAGVGVVEGEVVELWRPLTLRHPVTGKRLEDRFVIGRLRLMQVRPTLTLARPVAELAREAQPGDLVILTVRRPADVTPDDGAAPPPDATEPPPERVGAAARHPDEAVIGELLERLSGASLAERIRAYEAFAAERPDGPFSRTLAEEAAALRILFEAETAPHEEIVSAPRVLSFAAPSSVWADRPVTLGIELSDEAVGAVLHYRTATSPTYHTLAMRPSGPGYFSAQVPEGAVSGPRLQFFVEATDGSGAPLSVVGDDSAPRAIDVLTPLEEDESTVTRSLRVITDYADYNRLRGDDRVWQTEGEFGMRFRDTGIRALRSGFGVYRGIGGSVEELDEARLEPREVGLTYGYVETEIAPVDAVGLIGRAIVGLGDDGVAGGGQALVRIGSDRGTNLLLGGELLGTVGLRSIAQLELATFDRVPILFRTEVSNQPAGASPSDDDVPASGTGDVSGGDGDIGARGIAQVGLRVVDGFVVAVRGSFQGRTIKHAGPGVGGGVSYQW